MKLAPASRFDPAATGAPGVRSANRVDPALIAVGALIVIAAVAKFVFSLGQPLGFDEVWTGMIASQRSLNGFIRQCYLDVNAPLAYAVEWLWASLAGLSNEALRFPSVMFAGTAPLLALTPNRFLPRTVRLTWAALLACWLPGFVFASEARSYSQIFFIGAGNAVAYLTLIGRPSTKTAFLWTTASSLLILTHYMALPLVACQGVAFLIVHRLRALRTWPALLAFIPALVSLGAHAALLVAFSSHSAAGSTPLRLSETPQLIAFVFGGRSASWILLAWGVVSLALGGLRTRAAHSQAKPTVAPVWVAPATSMAAAAICLSASLAHPFIIDRYLTPVVPGALLGIALMAHKLGQSWRLAPAALVALQFGLVVGQFPGALRERSRFGFEEASSDLMQAGVQRLAFFWDSPSGGGDPDAFAQVGGFFFHRSGHPVEVDAVKFKPGEDPNPTIALRERRPRSAILWLYDDRVAGAAARRHPPRIDRIDSAWRCRDFGDGLQHVIACSRAPAS